MKYLSYLSVLLFCSFLVTCQDQILDKSPLGLIGEDNAYVTESDATKALTAAYNLVAANNWCCTYSGPGYMHWVLGNVASDDAVKGGESGSDQLYAQQVSLFNIPTDNDATRFAWSSQYVGVRRANLVLDNIPKIEMNDALKNRYVGEAKFLRAWFYINLVKTFGGVPIVLDSKTETLDKTRSSRDEVYDQIIKDLQEAIELLPLAYEDKDRGRATKGAAQAYLGKVYLYRNNFPKAEEMFGKVINSGVYQLDPDYYGMFLRDGENSPEHIFQAQFDNQGADPARNFLHTVMGSRARGGWGFNTPTQDFVDSFEDDDPRLNHTVYAEGDTMPDGSIANVGNTPTGYLNKKMYVPDFERIQGGLRAGKDDIYMRLGKVMLWYAEAANENGNTQAALDALNEIRERAREGEPNTLPDISEENKNELREIIWREQRVEFGQEYERFFELVRQGRAGEVMRGFAEKYNTAKGSGFRDGVNEIFPIPQEEINLNEGRIEQNPGY